MLTKKCEELFCLKTIFRLLAEAFTLTTVETAKKGLRSKIKLQRRKMESRLKDMEDIFTIVTDTTKTGKNRNLQDLPQVVVWFENLKEHLPSEWKNLTSSQAIPLLKECLLTQRYKSAIQLISVLAETPRKHADIVQRTALEVMYQDPRDNKEIVDQFVNQMRWLCEIDAKSLVLEYVFFLLHLGEIDSAKQAFQMVPKKRGIIIPTDESIYVDTVFKAYQGLVWYIEWKAAKQKAEFMDSQVDLDFLLLSQQSASTNYEEVMKTHAQKALAAFADLVDKEGVWDIFITKQLELLEYYQKEEEARHILVQYRERNPENPNSHKYLYDFICRHGDSDHDKITVLKDLAEHVPSDSLVMELCELLKRDGKHVEVLCYICDLLDYESYMLAEKPWKIMVSSLEAIKDRSCIDELWEARVDLWPEYHFSPDETHCTSTPVCQLCMCKAMCAHVFLGKENKFTEKIKSLMDETQREEFGRKRKQLNIEIVLT